MTGRRTPSGVTLITRHELASLQELPDNNMLMIQDHISDGNGDLSGLEHFVNLVRARQWDAPPIVVEYVRFDPAMQLHQSVMPCPIQAFFVSQALAKHIRPNAWGEKTSAFNFMINKPRHSRTWLVDRLSELDIHTDHYSMACSDRGSYARRCWTDARMQVVSDQVLNGSVSNIEIYQSWLKCAVFEPTVFSLITEPAWQEPAFFMSEKTIWAWESGTMPIWVGSWGAADSLADLGFDVFYDVIDHGYQRETDPDRRLNMAIDRNQDLLRDKEGAVELWEKHRHRVEFNRQHMRSGDWMQEHVRREVARFGLLGREVVELLFYLLDDRSNFESNRMLSQQDHYLNFDRKEIPCMEEPANLLPLK